MLRIRLSNLNNDSMIESIDHLLYNGKWSERVKHEDLSDAILEMMELEPEKFREYMFYVALKEIIRKKIKDSVKIAMNKEYIVVEVIPIVSQVLRDLQERNIIVDYSLSYFSGPSGDEREFTEDIEVSYWLDADKKFEYEIFY